MSSTLSSSTAPSPPTAPGVVGESSLVDQRLSQTSRQVKWVDASVVTMQLVVLTLGYLLAIAAVDHWVAPLGTMGRWLALLGLLGTVGFVGYRRLLPLLIHRINPVYAARAIESGTPSLKNSLINYLLLRRDVDTLAPGMYVALEGQAVQDVQTEQVDSAVDKSILIRYGYVLAAVIAVCAVYKVASPKDPLQSLQRVLMPWAGVGVPTRFEILEVTPGNHRVFLGEKQIVTTTVAGSKEPELVELSYSTTDGRQTGHRIPMEKFQDHESRYRLFGRAFRRARPGQFTRLSGSSRATRSPRSIASMWWRLP